MQTPMGSAPKHTLVDGVGLNIKTLQKKDQATMWSIWQ